MPDALLGLQVRILLVIHLHQIRPSLLGGCGSAIICTVKDYPRLLCSPTVGGRLASTKRQLSSNSGCTKPPRQPPEWCLDGGVTRNFVPGS